MLKCWTPHHREHCHHDSTAVTINNPTLLLPGMLALVVLVMPLLSSLPYFTQIPACCLVGLLSDILHSVPSFPSPVAETQLHTWNDLWKLALLVLSQIISISAILCYLVFFSSAVKMLPPSLFILVALPFSGISSYYESPSQYQTSYPFLSILFC